eukprot:TRINITY_DN11771_c0_g1_i1.p1 TRINITY_DN11771_c0_g1~~TRINITY_DN11771_c0_g1_i1.p1  ORF type:complete len:587 (+),score=118.00 TRINITY_DN11771_c0_g1_i1:96-1856(+)
MAENAAAVGDKRKLSEKAGNGVDGIDHEGGSSEPNSKERKTQSLKPLNGFTNALLMDMYEVTMAYSYWKHGKHEQHGVFDLFFRQCPFRGEFAIFSGLEECLRFVNSYKFSDKHLAYLESIMPSCDKGFWEWLRTVDCSKIKIYAQVEGSPCFPKVPLLRVEGPIAIAQLLETPLLNLVNYATLVTTNASRYRLAGGNMSLLEFGARRAQGPDGAVSASRYAIMGGFDGTSNVLAGYLFDVVPKGTIAHSFITSFSLKDKPSLQQKKFIPTPESSCTEAEKKDGVAFLDLVYKCRQELGYQHTHEGELIAFTAYAMSYPTNVMVLVDTYETLSSGVRNFLCVALALHRVGYKAVGVRLDSGDLAYLSNECRALFKSVAQQFNVDYFANLSIVASNDLSEKTLLSLNQQGHEINVFGIGTDVVTCKSQPALGGVYKLVELDGRACIKLSEEFAKVSLPGKKDAYRLFDKTGTPIFDVLTLHNGKEVPEANRKILCRHPFEETKRAYVTPSKVVPLLQLVWDGSNNGIQVDLPSLSVVKDRVKANIKVMRPDHLRPLNPTPYKVSVTSELYDFIHSLWMSEAPVKEIE